MKLQHLFINTLTYTRVPVFIILVCALNCAVELKTSLLPAGGFIFGCVLFSDFFNICTCNNSKSNEQVFWESFYVSRANESSHFQCILNDFGFNPKVMSLSS